MLPTSAGVEPATSWSPVGWRIQLSHRGQLDPQEILLKDYILKASNIYFGLSPKEVRYLAYECAIRFEIPIPKMWQENLCAGADWFTSFMKRHPELSIRTPEPTSLSRATSFNRENVKLFFSKPAEVMDRDNLGPEQIWNVDETGISTVQKPRNVVAAKGVKQIGSVTSGERGSLAQRYLPLATWCPLCLSSQGKTLKTTLFVMVLQAVLV